MGFAASSMALIQPPLHSSQTHFATNSGVSFVIQAWSVSSAPPFDQSL
jgi:hypothetical protein